MSTGGGGSPTATAELTWALILAARRHIPHEVEALKNGLWQTRFGSGLAGTVLGVYALGRIGSLVAQIGKSFGMEVLCWGRDVSMARAQEAGYRTASSRSAFFCNADVVSIHIPFTEQTRGIITAHDLAAMKPDALIVNTSRAALFAPGSLLEALRLGRPGSAAIDVFEHEPTNTEREPLIGLPNVVCTPHLGYVTRNTLQMIYDLAIDQVLAFAVEMPINVLM
jgi:D-3-phosphoglycerate dehydrogenase